MRATTKLETPPSKHELDEQLRAEREKSHKSCMGRCKRGNKMMFDFVFRQLIGFNAPLLFLIELVWVVMALLYLTNRYNAPLYSIVVTAAICVAPPLLSLIHSVWRKHISKTEVLLERFEAELKEELEDAGGGVSDSDSSSALTGEGGVAKKLEVLAQFKRNRAVMKAQSKMALGSLVYHTLILGIAAQIYNYTDADKGVQNAIDEGGIPTGAGGVANYSIQTVIVLINFILAGIVPLSVVFQEFLDAHIFNPRPASISKTVDLIKGDGDTTTKASDPNDESSNSKSKRTGRSKSRNRV
jgi:hypothetical protein